MDKQITIRMPKELLAKWLAALRSGEYKQAQQALECNGGYCCLGVLQHVVDGAVETFNGNPLPLPSKGWLKRNGIEFKNTPVAAWGRVTPFLPLVDDRADWANDSGVTFPELADAIEACAEGV